MAKKVFVLSQSERDRLAKVMQEVEGNRPPGSGTGNGNEETPTDPWIGQVICTGPLGTEADYTDHRYWISKTYINGVTTAEKANTAAIVWTEALAADTDVERFVITAENLSEQPYGTHLVPEGAIVLVHNGQDVTGNPVERFFFELEPYEIYGYLCSPCTAVESTVAGHNARRPGDDRLPPHAWKTHTSLTNEDNLPAMSINASIDWTDPVTGVKSRYYAGSFSIYNPTPPNTPVASPFVRWDDATEKIVDVAGANNQTGMDVVEFNGDLVVLLKGTGTGGSVRVWDGTSWTDGGTSRPVGFPENFLIHNEKLFATGQSTSGLGPWSWTGSGAWSVVGGAGLDRVSGTPVTHAMTEWGTDPTVATVTTISSFADPITTITISTSLFSPNMVGQNMVFTLTGNAYPIAAYTSGTVVTVTGDASTETNTDTVTIATPTIMFGGKFDRVGTSGVADTDNVIGWNDAKSTWVYIEGLPVSNSSGKVQALIGFDSGEGNGSELMAGGWNITSTKLLMKYDGFSWEPTGGDLTLTTFNPSTTGPKIYTFEPHIDKCGNTRLLVGGFFEELFKANAEGSGNLDHLGDFDTSGTLDAATLSSPAGVDKTVRASAIYSGDYIVGGAFETDIASGNSVGFIGKVNDTTGEVEQLDTGLDGNVFSMVENSGDLYFTGDMQNGSGLSITRFGRWTGTAFEGLASGGLNGRGRCCISDSNFIVIVGDFTNYTTSGTPVAPGIGRYDVTTNTYETNIFGLGLTYLGNPAKVNCVYLDSGAYYVGAQIDKAGTTTVSGIAKFTISTKVWSALGSGVDGEVHDILVDNAGDVHAVGNFTGSGWQKWNGSSWATVVNDDYSVSRSIIEANVDGTLRVFVDGKNPTGAGSPSNIAYGSPAKSIGLTNGSFDNDIYTMVYDSVNDQIRCGGSFGSGGTDATNPQLSTNCIVSYGLDGMDQWNGGVGWHPYTINTSPALVRDITTLTLDNGDPELSVVGSFVGGMVNERYARGIAAYTNKGFIPMGKGVNGTNSTGIEGPVSAVEMPPVQLQTIETVGGTAQPGTDNKPRKGTFTVKAVAGDTPQTLDWNFTNSEMKTAIEAFTSIGTGNVTCTGDESVGTTCDGGDTGGRLNPCRIVFDASLGVVPTLIVANVNLDFGDDFGVFGCDTNGAEDVAVANISRASKAVCVVGNFDSLENEPGRGAELEISSNAAGRFSNQIWSAMTGLPSGFRPYGVTYFDHTAWTFGTTGDKCYKFDLTTDQWESAATTTQFPDGGGYRGIIAFGDYIYAFGQYDFESEGSKGTIARRTATGSWASVQQTDANLLMYRDACIADLGSGDTLYVIGQDTTATNIVKSSTNGTTWTDVGTNLKGSGNGITGIDYGSGMELAVSGANLEVTTVPYVAARWNGTTWSGIAKSGAGSMLDVFGNNRLGKLLLLGNLPSITDASGIEQSTASVMHYDPTNGIVKAPGCNAEVTRIS